DVELYASSPLVHKEKLTGSHHTSAYKPRMGHASSSRETIVYDENDKKSLTQSETNGEPRRENLSGCDSNPEHKHNSQTP
ncbi:hypothetical protein O181_079204, partial [Austropuccinia psidii MF-1]|nr:hypothetical protein [Austropuccinia psidii MF-1]